MKIFKKKFQPSFWYLSVATFKDLLTMPKIANDVIYGLGAGVWSRSAHTSYRAVVQFNRVAFGPTVTTFTLHMPLSVAIKKSGIGRENHKMMLTLSPN